MRDAIAQLLGYKLVFKEGGKIRLTSVYGPDDAHLIFGAPEEGEKSRLKLLGATGEESTWQNSEMVQNSISFWVTDRRVSCSLLKRKSNSLESLTVLARFS